MLRKGACFPSLIKYTHIYTHTEKHRNHFQNLKTLHDKHVCAHMLSAALLVAKDSGIYFKCLKPPIFKKKKIWVLINLQLAPFFW